MSKVVKDLLRVASRVAPRLLCVSQGFAGVGLEVSLPQGHLVFGAVVARAPAGRLPGRREGHDGHDWASSGGCHPLRGPRGGCEVSACFRGSRGRLFEGVI